MLFCVYTLLYTYTYIGIFWLAFASHPTSYVIYICSFELYPSCTYIYVWYMYSSISTPCTHKNFKEYWHVMDHLSMVCKRVPTPFHYVEFSSTTYNPEALQLLCWYPSYTSPSFVYHFLGYLTQLMHSFHSTV